MDFKIKFNQYNKDDSMMYGNMLLTGNGYFGIRGTFEEYTKEMYGAINMSGIYDRSEPDAWRESVNAPNCIYVKLEADKETYSLPDTLPSNHYHELDFKYGIFTRKTVWKTNKGTITLESERFASMHDKHLVCVKYTVFFDYDCKIKLTSGINTDIWNINGNHFAKVEKTSDNGYINCICTTIEKNIELSLQEYDAINTNCKKSIINDENGIFNVFEINAKKDEKYVLEKITKISSSVDKKASVTDLKKTNYENLKKLHISEWDKIWDISFVEIKGDKEAEKALNFCIYELNAIAPRHTDAGSIPARGLSAQVYKGAIFWDTEMFMFDYFLHTDVSVARTLINYRIKTMGGAMIKAKEYGYEGAFYAWESQEDGIDACSEFNIIDPVSGRPLKTHFRDKQIHISADIIYALKRYVEYTKDYSILDEGGKEMVIQCALFYRSAIVKRLNSNFYELHNCIGPDEYHECINNNAYTNKMAKMVFDYAYELTKNDDTEHALMFKDCADKLYIPSPRKEDDVIEQFDGYFKMENCSVEDLKKREYTKGEYWGGAYGIATQTQILKQADVATMLCMFKDEYSNKILKANFDYYEKRTQHGSSLSACMYSLLGCYLGNAESAYPLFMTSALADLKEERSQWSGKVFIGGTHPASAGGAWMCAILGFAGLGIKDGKITLNPCLPESFEEMNFKIVYNGKKHNIKVTRTKCFVD